MVQARRVVAWVVGVGALALALGGCGDGGQDRPEGAVMLQENQPTTWRDVRLVAGNIWDESIVLSVDDGDGPAETADLAVGERATVKGLTFELLEVHEDTGDGAPGGSGSRAWVLPVE